MVVARKKNMNYYDREGSKTNKRSKEQLTQSSTDDAIDHRVVMKVISRAVKNTKEAYLHMANMMVFVNSTPMGTCVCELTELLLNVLNKE